MDDAVPQVVNNTAGSRFELTAEGRTAVHPEYEPVRDEHWKAAIE